MGKPYLFVAVCNPEMTKKFSNTHGPWEYMALTFKSNSAPGMMITDHQFSENYQGNQSTSIG